MTRLVLTLCTGMVALLLLGFAFLALTDMPVVQSEIVTNLPAPSSR